MTDTGNTEGTSRKWTVKNYFSLSLLLGILGAIVWYLPGLALAVAVVGAAGLVFVMLRDGLLRWVKRSPERERRWMMLLEGVRFAQEALVKWIAVAIGVVIILAIVTLVATNLSTVTINPLYVGIAIIIVLLIMILYKLDTK